MNNLDVNANSKNTSIENISIENVGGENAGEKNKRIYKKEDLKEQLHNMGLTGSETILIHSSMKAIGNVEGRADTVLDVWMDYFSKGLLLLPTHTWKTVNVDNPIYNPLETPSCVGILTNLFMKREGVIRSLHPTHSMAGYGENAARYLAGEEYNNTPCTPGGCYDRLKEVNGKVLLVGVGHERNTYIHSVEEVLNIPNRLSDKPMELMITFSKSAGKDKLPVYGQNDKYINILNNNIFKSNNSNTGERNSYDKDKVYRKVYVRKHYNAQQPHISEDFVKLNKVFLDCGVVRKVKFGDADSLLCDARGMFEVVRYVIAKEPECIVTKNVQNIPF